MNLESEISAIIDRANQIRQEKHPVDLVHDNAEIQKIKEILKKPLSAFATHEAHLVGCDNLKKITCLARLIAATIVCGGPENIPCIIASLGTMADCIECL